MRGGALGASGSSARDEALSASKGSMQGAVLDVGGLGMRLET